MAHNFRLSEKCTHWQFERMTEKPQSMCFETKRVPINNQVYCSE